MGLKRRSNSVGWGVGSVLGPDASEPVAVLWGGLQTLFSWAVQPSDGATVGKAFCRHCLTELVKLQEICTNYLPPSPKKMKMQNLTNQRQEETHQLPVWSIKIHRWFCFSVNLCSSCRSVRVHRRPVCRVMYTIEPTVAGRIIPSQIIPSQIIPSQIISSQTISSQMEV